MPRKLRIQLLEIIGVVASGVVTVTVPVGRRRLHGIIIEHGYASGTNTIAATATNIAEARFLLNGSVQRQVSGTQWRDKMLLNGTAYDSLVGGVPNTAPGVSMFMPFAEPWMADEQDQDALALQLGGFEDARLELTLGAASTPTITALGIFDDSSAGNGNLSKWVRMPAVAGSTSFQVPGIDKKDFWRVASIYPDSGGSVVPSKVIMKVGGKTIHDLSTTQNRALLQASGMTPAASGRTASIYDVVFDHDGLLDSAVDLNGQTDISLEIQGATAMSGTSTIILERFGPPA